MLRSCCGILLLSSLALRAAPVADRFTPAPYRGQKIGGILGERLRVNLHQRLLRIDEPALLAGFQKRPGSHPWIGEHIGKYLHAAANAYALTGNSELKAQMDRMVPALIATQLPDGYLGTYTDDQRWTSWDVWSHKYNLIGLLAYYDITGYEPALAAARRIGDLLERTFGDTPGKRDIIAASTHVGMAASSVLEPLCILYQRTREPRYLELARYLVRSWEQPHGPRIISSLLSTGSVYQTANGKAYEMMSDLVGLVELHRITGEPDYRRAAEVAWNDIRTRRLYLTGTTSAREHFQDDFELTGYSGNEVGEGCATVTWLQLTWQLLRLTCEARYAEELERTVYNQLLAAQDPSNGNICYFTPLIGRKNATPGINCCVSSEPRGISMIPQLAWGALGEAAAILLYTPGEVELPMARIRSVTDFPDSGKVTLTIEPTTASRRFPLLLRVPAWTRSFHATAGGKTYTGKAGEFLAIEREWTPGDQVTLDIDITVAVLDGGRSYPGFVAVRRGPQVLALDQASNPDVPYLHLASLAGKPELAPLAGRQAWTTPGTAVAGGRKRATKLVLVPFADARQDYRIWIAPQSKLSTAPVPLSAFANESASARGRWLGSITDTDPNTYRDTGARRPNQPQDWFAVNFTAPVEMRRIIFHHGASSAEGGWFEGQPVVEVQREPKGAWERVGVLEAYPGTASAGRQLKPGTPFELKLATPLRGVAVRVAGKPAGQYSTCAELEVF